MKCRAVRELEEHNGTLATLHSDLAVRQSLGNQLAARLTSREALASPSSIGRARRVQTRASHPLHRSLVALALAHVRAQVKRDAALSDLRSGGGHVARGEVEDGNTSGAVARRTSNGVPDGVDGELRVGRRGDESDLRLLGLANGLGDHEESDEGGSCVWLAVAVRGGGVPLVVL